jgi:hypothetical protein
MTGKLRPVSHIVLKKSLQNMRLVGFRGFSDDATLSSFSESLNLNISLQVASAVASSVVQGVSSSVQVRNPISSFVPVSPLP